MNTENKKDLRLIYAAAAGDLSEVKQLIAEGVDVNIASKNGYTALMSTAGRGHAEIAKILLDAGADINLQNELEVYRKWKEDGKPNTHMMPPSGFTALMFAALRGQAKVAKVLLDAGANIKATNIDGFTALTFAALSGNSEIVKALLDAGANVDTKSDEGNTAVDFAKTPEIVALLQKS